MKAATKRNSALVIVVAGVVSAVVVWAIRLFGANNVQAFGSVMSFAAVVVAAIATVIYVHKTAEIASATLETAREQSRVARLMEDDLKIRIEPYLRYEPLPGPTDRPQGHIRNGGSGTAVDLKAVVQFASARELPLEVSQSIEPRHDNVETVSFACPSGEAPVAFILTCTDSLRLCDYRFEWTNDKS